MSDMDMGQTAPEAPRGGATRRSFIKGVIAAGAAVSTSRLSVPHLDCGPALGARLGRAPHLDHRQRPGAPRRCAEAGNPGDDAPLQAGAHRHQARLRSRRVRRLHGAGRRRAALFVLDAHALAARPQGADHRGPRRPRRHAAPGAAGRGRRAGLPVRVLHARLRDGHGRLPQDQPEPDARRNWRTASPATCAAARTTTRSSRRSCTAPSWPGGHNVANNYKYIGHNYTTPDLVAKVTGKARYAEDHRAEGMLFAKLLLSPMPHARVVNVDAAAALALPGVKAILRASDFPAPPPPPTARADSRRRRRRCRLKPRSPTSRSTRASRFWRSPPSTRPPRPRRSSCRTSPTSRCPSSSIRSTACVRVAPMPAPRATSTPAPARR